TGMFLGTPEYSAPEQVLGHEVGPWTDQYALAVVTFSLLTGERLFRGDQLAVMYAHVSDAPPAASSLRPRLPAAADEGLFPALAKAPGARSGSCGEFTDALRAALGLVAYGSIGEEQRPRDTSPRNTRPATRQPWSPPDPSAGRWPPQGSPDP